MLALSIHLRSSKAKTVSENLKMNSALLSRFDLVFILLDRPDEEMDMFLSEHIIKVCLVHIIYGCRIELTRLCCMCH